MKPILALVLRAVLISCAAFCAGAAIFIAASRRGEFSLLKFHGLAGFSGVKHRLDLRGLKFKGEKFHKAAE